MQSYKDYKKADPNPLSTASVAVHAVRMTTRHSIPQSEMAADKINNDQTENVSASET